jgi:BASS family bile acid:Na+ symporter
MPSVLPGVDALTEIAPHVLVAAYLAAMMLVMGLELGNGPPESKDVKRRQRRLLIRGLLMNLVLFPVVAVGLTRVLHTSGDAAIALLLLAAAPGGRFAPQLTRTAGGDVPLSVEITLFLAKLTPFIAPTMARWMLGVHHIELHEMTFLVPLVLLQLVPYFTGRALRHRRRALAERLLGPARIASTLFLAVLVIWLLVHREFRSVLSLRGPGWLAVLAFAVVALALGWLLGGPTPRTRRAFAISATARELPLALVMASLAFPHGSVRTAVLGAWLVLSGFTYAFARLARQEAGTAPVEPTISAAA